MVWVKLTEWGGSESNEFSVLEEATRLQSLHSASD